MKTINKFLKKGIHWIQSHPIAGSEVSGPEHGKENMFTDRWCIIIKEKNIKKNNINILTKFWKKIGAKVVVMSCLLYTSPSPRDYAASRMPSSA